MHGKFDLLGSINIIIIFFTFLAILWYSYETLKLRKEAQKQNITSIRPYLILQWGKDGRLGIFNKGKGVVVNIVLKYLSGENSVAEPPQFKKIPTMSANIGRTYALLSKIEDFKYLDPGQYTYRVEANYTDIERRSYHAIFETDLEYNDKFKILEQEEGEI